MAQAGGKSLVAKHKKQDNNWRGKKGVAGKRKKRTLDKHYLQREGINLGVRRKVS